MCVFMHNISADKFLFVSLCVLCRYQEYKLAAKHKMRRVFGVVQTMMTTLKSTREQLVG